MSVLLLQGPLGPFFDHLARRFKQVGLPVHKIHFNGGDESYYYQNNALAFSGSPEQWPAFLSQFMRDHNIKLVMAYGDCRFYHHEAKRLCINNGVQYIALEEGYLRPNYITLEVNGVNGHSPIKHDGVEAYRPMHTIHDEVVMPGNFLKRTRYAIKYYVTNILKKQKFAHYMHHRAYNAFAEAGCWIRAYARKQFYKISEPSASRLTRKSDFFLVPLQVHNDAQIEFHSQYESIEHFIQEVMLSFALNKCTQRLVIKHHPMDRGHVNYKQYINKLAKELGISQQVDYIHDQHLPTLLKACKGIVTINSTTALQAFYHEAPVKVMGNAFFNMPGLTDQKTLAEFWVNPEKPDMEFADRFRGYLLDHGQINGSFYCQFRFTCDNIIQYMQSHGMLDLQPVNNT
ncbi:capsule biosynthesis protein [Bermanella sp. WJH001]|uniref:capsule biosynthesis protein n=1 Tax=Bermanella sp. WJH001 TaxID=3048005 RepID=UPI0024BDC084|nr:capsular biosynthesis protein [Bermanella sp. WJH001]MDJ1539616.1 capsular biosynthesis protein [Bermanella sp. WJH001]